MAPSTALSFAHKHNIPIKERPWLRKRKDNPKTHANPPAVEKVPPAADQSGLGKLQPVAGERRVNFVEEVKGKESPLREETVPAKPEPGGQAVPAGIQITIVQLPASAGLPEFPPFDKAWPPFLQVEWIQAYKDLARRG